QIGRLLRLNLVDDIEDDHAVADLGLKRLEGAVLLGMGPPDFECRGIEGHLRNRLLGTALPVNSQLPTANSQRQRWRPRNIGSWELGVHDFCSSITCLR